MVGLVGFAPAWESRQPRISHMPDKPVYLLSVDGFADSEPSHAIADLRRHGQYRVEAVGLTSDPVRSMGGIRVLPSTIVTNVDPADVAALFSPAAIDGRTRPSNHKSNSC